MTIVTHGLVAVLCAALADAGKANALAACIGAALPDIDSQHSSIGRIFFFIAVVIISRMLLGLMLKRCAISFALIAFCEPILLRIKSITLKRFSFTSTSTCDLT